MESSESGKAPLELEGKQSPSRNHGVNSNGSSEPESMLPGPNGPLDAISFLSPDFIGKRSFPDLPQPGGSQDYKFYPGFSPIMNMAYDEMNKVYVCHLCDFRTAFRNSLLNHQAVHSDVRPWVCAMCEYAAKRKQDLKKHLHTVHGMMVESTHLKPVGVSSPGVQGQLESEGGSGVWDGAKQGKSESDLVGGHAGGPNVSTSKKIMSKLQTPSFDQLVHNKNKHAIKQELLDRPPSPEIQGILPSMSEFVDRKSCDSPEEDLPLSFPPVSPSQFKPENVSPPSDLSPGEIASDEFTFKNPQQDAFERQQMNSQRLVSHQRESKVHESNVPFHLPSPVEPQRKLMGKRSRESSLDHFASIYDKTAHHHHSQSASSSMSASSPPPHNKMLRRSDAEDPTSCSSSTYVTRVQESQTRQSFLCEYCDIMFFQRAMYLMHAGLHSPDNPWNCTVCGCTFTEKYSFTSHFINQH